VRECIDALIAKKKLAKLRTESDALFAVIGFSVREGLK